MTTFSSSRGLLPGSGGDHRWQNPSRRVEGPRNVHRAEGWAIALASATVLWGLIIGGVSHLVSLVG